MLAMSSVASANVIVTDSDLTGADMVGLEVSVNYDDGSTASGIWQFLSNTVLNTGNAIADAEGQSGGVFNNSFELTQQGFTFGDIGSPGSNFPGQLFGLWTFINYNTAANVSSIVLNGMINGPAQYVFDRTAGTEVTPGSNVGRAFTPSLKGVTGVYSNQVNGSYDDLFYTLTINFSQALVAGEPLQFMADTDQVSVSEPGILALMLVGFGLAARRSVGARAKK